MSCGDIAIHTVWKCRHEMMDQAIAVLPSLTLTDVAPAYAITLSAVCLAGVAVVLMFAIQHQPNGDKL